MNREANDVEQLASGYKSMNETISNKIRLYSRHVPEVLNKQFSHEVMHIDLDPID